MSSYLTFYLVPKKTRKNYYYDENKDRSEKEIELSKGLPLALYSYSRSNEIYQAFTQNLSVAYCGNEEKYTDLTVGMCDDVIDSIKEDINNAEERLNVDYKMLKESGYSSEMYEEIHSEESYIKDLKSTLDLAKEIRNMVVECTDGYNDFEKVLINVD